MGLKFAVWTIARQLSYTNFIKKKSEYNFQTEEALQDPWLSTLEYSIKQGGKIWNQVSNFF